MPNSEVLSVVAGPISLAIPIGAGAAAAGWLFNFCLNRWKAVQQELLEARRIVEELKAKKTQDQIDELKAMGNRIEIRMHEHEKELLASRTESAELRTSFRHMDTSLSNVVTRLAAAEKTGALLERFFTLRDETRRREEAQPMPAMPQGKQHIPNVESEKVQLSTDTVLVRTKKQNAAE